MICGVILLGVPHSVQQDLEMGKRCVKILKTEAIPKRTMDRLLKDSHQENLGRQVRQLACRFENIKGLDFPLLSVTDSALRRKLQFKRSASPVSDRSFSDQCVHWVSRPSPLKQRQGRLSKDSNSSETHRTLFTLLPLLSHNGRTYL